MIEANAILGHRKRRWVNDVDRTYVIFNGLNFF